MPKFKHIETSKLKLFYFFRFLGDGATYAFLPIFYMFVYPGDSPREILYKSILVAVQPAMAILSNFVIGKISGNEKRNLTIIKIMLPIEIALISSIGFVSFSFALLLIFSCLAYFMDMACFSLMDSTAGDVLAIEGGKYMWVRLTGSFAYMVMNFLIGFIVASINSKNVIIGYSYGFLCMLPAYILGYVSLFYIQPYNIDEYKEDNFNNEEKDVSQCTYNELFKNKDFVLYLLFIGLIIGLTCIIDNTYSDYYSSVIQGGTMNKDPIKLSTSSFPMYITEIVVSIIAFPLIKPKGYKALMLLSGSFLVIRGILLGTFSYFGTDVIPYGLFVTSNSLRGFTYAVYVTANIPILQNILGIKLKTKAIFMVNLFYNSINLIGQLTYNSIIVGFKNIGLGSGHYMNFYIIAILGFLSLFLLPFIKVNTTKSEEVTKK